jgi:hypothetical protein
MYKFSLYTFCIKGDSNHVVKANAENVGCSLPHSAEHVAVMIAAPAHSSLEYSE